MCCTAFEGSNTSTRNCRKGDYERFVGVALETGQSADMEGMNDGQIRMMRLIETRRQGRALRAPHRGQVDVVGIQAEVLAQAGPPPPLRSSSGRELGKGGNGGGRLQRLPWRRERHARQRGPRKREGEGVLGGLLQVLDSVGCGVRWSRAGTHGGGVHALLPMRSEVWRPGRDGLCGWIPYNAGFGFLDRPRGVLGVLASLDRF